jgi:cyclase
MNVWIKRILGFIAFLLLLLIGLVIFFYPVIKDFRAFDVVETGQGITYVLGGGGNSGIIVGTEKVVVIDTKMGAAAKKLLKLANEKAAGKEIIVVNTHYHPDHISGNELFAGARIIAGNYGEERWAADSDATQMPTEWISQTDTLDLGERKAVLLYIGNTHTAHDLAVYLPAERVLFAGDIFVHESHPVLMESSTPNVSKWVQVLQGWQQVSLETVVPGHGSLAEQEDIAALTDYFHAIQNHLEEADELDKLKNKYKDWKNIPFMSGFNQTVAYLKSH